MTQWISSVRYNFMTSTMPWSAVFSPFYPAQTPKPASISEYLVSFFLFQGATRQFPTILGKQTSPAVQWMAGALWRKLVGDGKATITRARDVCPSWRALFFRQVSNWCPHCSFSLMCFSFSFQKKTRSGQGWCWRSPPLARREGLEA